MYGSRSRELSLFGTEEDFVLLLLIFCMIRCQGHQDRVGKEGGDNGNLSIEKKV